MGLEVLSSNLEGKTREKVLFIIGMKLGSKRKFYGQKSFLLYEVFFRRIIYRLTNYSEIIKPKTNNCVRKILPVSGTVYCSIIVRQ